MKTPYVYAKVHICMFIIYIYIYIDGVLYTLFSRQVGPHETVSEAIDCALHRIQPAT